MRHEIRDSNSLVFTMEEVVGGGPVGGSSPTIDIYSIEFDEWWDQLNVQWDALPPVGSNAMIDMAVVNAALSGVYSFDASGAYAAPGATANNSGAQGYIVKMEDAANGYLEFVFIVISDLMVSSATVPAVVDANVVQWLGTAATASTAGVPNVNIAEIDGDAPQMSPDPTATGLLSVDIARVNGDADVFSISDPSILRVDIDQINSQNVPVMTGTGVLDVNVTAWDDETTGVGTSATYNLPLVDVVTVRDSADAGRGLEDFGDTGYDRITHKVEAVKVVDLISGDGITESSFVDDAITSRVFADDAITSDVIADDAIDEGAIAIDSVTYEEISTSAAREISDAVWSADIFKSIYNDHPTGTPAPAPLGTIGHAITIDHLKDGINYWSATESTSAHKCAFVDPTGTKFYSHHLASSDLSPAQITAYIDRSVTIVKEFDFDAMEFDESSKSYLGRIISVGQDADGQYFELSQVDEDASAIPGGFKVGEDIIIIKSETDSTMHEVAHEVWEESVFDHETPDTFGMFSRIMTGLAQFNHRITDSTYDDSGRLLACRLVVYPTPEDADNETNSLTSVIVTSTYNEKQNMSTFLAREEDAGE